MSRSRVRASLERVARRAAGKLLQRFVWQASERHNLAGTPVDHHPLVVVLGREHYSESRKSYPALRRRDLQKVLRVELAGQPPTLFVIGSLHGDRREVSFYRFDQSVVDTLPRSLFIVPETVLLASQLAAGTWAEVERQDYRYFLFGDGSSQPAGGALANRQLVALAAGMDSGVAPEEWRGSAELLQRLRRALTALPASTWWACRNPVPRTSSVLARIAWRPVALTAAAMLFGYLALSTLYLQATLGQREGALEKWAPEVQEGLVADSEARALDVRRDALMELWSGRLDTQQIWAGVASVLEHGAKITRIEMQGRRVSLSGDGPDASDILVELAGLPAFEAVAFDAPVRAARGGRQSFALSFELADAPAHGDDADD